MAPRDLNTIKDAETELLGIFGEDQHLRELVFPPRDLPPSDSISLNTFRRYWRALAEHETANLDDTVNVEVVGIGQTTARRALAAYLANSVCNFLGDEAQASEIREVGDRLRAAVPVIREFVRERLGVVIDETGVDVVSDGPQDTTGDGVVDDVLVGARPASVEVRKFKTVGEAWQAFLPQIPDFIRQAHFDQMNIVFGKMSSMPIEGYGDTILGIYISGVYDLLIAQLRVDIEVRKLACPVTPVGVGISELLQSIVAFPGSQAAEVRATLAFMRNFVEQELGYAELTFEEIPT